MVAGIAYTIRPSFVTPYLTARVEEVEPYLFLRKFDVPFWALARISEHPATYWYRLEQHLGSFSLVGTTISRPEVLPEHVLADEKHSKILKRKAYIAFTVAQECVLGAGVSWNADEAGLLEAYRPFQQEAQKLLPNYPPKTVNVDGWEATENTWKILFPTIVCIRCLLHVFIKVRDRFTKKKEKRELFKETADWFWKRCFQATSKTAFSQNLRRFDEWSKKQDLNESVALAIAKMREKRNDYRVAFDFPGAHRTSNMLDRLMRRLDRRLFSSQFLHGSLAVAQKHVRARALIYNFAPSNPQTVKRYKGWQSPAERLNQFQYHECWLQNLFISASLGGFRGPPQN